MVKKKNYLLCTLMACMMAVPTLAGGLMTNTNYHIAFDRMMARGATFDIDAIYSNPAGLAWGHEGWQISFDVQKPFQYRNIEASLQATPALAAAVGFTDHKFKGKASANPFVPALFASYKHNNWALGMMAGIVGSGGKVKYDEGVPQFVVPVRGMMSQIATNVNGALPAGYPAVPGNFYDLDAYMEGKQYIYGIQANFTYRFNDHWSAAAGVRGNIYSGYNRGHVISTTANPVVQGAMGMTSNEVMKLNLDVDQSGFGIAPLLSVNYRWKDLTLTGRYEFRTKLSIPNDTKALEVAAAPALAGQLAAVAPMTAPYQDGVKTRYDMPGLLSLAAGYEFIPNKLRATLEYHWFDDKNAKMQGDRQEQLSHGTQEILAGIEWDINKTFTVSCGAQRTDYGLTDQYQTNTSFACDSYSVGLGGAVNITSHLRVNLGYFCSIYSDYTRQANYMNIPLSETYSRTNHVFGVGVDYKF